MAEKKYHIAIIKIVAILLVIFNHTGTRGFLLFSVAQDSPLLPVYLFSTIACKIAVPLFFMCSGALLLPKDESIKKLYTRRILRYALVIIFSTFVSYLYRIQFDLTRLDLAYFFRTVYSSHEIETAYWFLYSYLGSLILLPFLRGLARAVKRNEMVYLITLHIVFSGIIPSLEFLLNRDTFHIYIYLQLLSQGIFYMIVGYYFENRLDIHSLTRKHIMWGITASLFLIALGGVMTEYRGVVTGRFSGSDAFHSGFIAIPTITAYVLIKYASIRRSPGKCTAEIVSYLSSLTFGIYLLHNIFMELLSPVYEGLYPYLRSFLSVLILVAVTAILSGGVTALLKRVPIIRQLL